MFHCKTLGNCQNLNKQQIMRSSDLIGFFIADKQALGAGSFVVFFLIRVASPSKFRGLEIEMAAFLVPFQGWLLQTFLWVSS